MLHKRFRLWFVLAALFSTLALQAQIATPFIRELPLNRFTHSRQANIDARGFYFMPTAIGDDYFDGASPPDRVRRHLRTARRFGAKYLRCAFSWNGIEKEQGKYDWTFWDAVVAAAEQNRIGLIPYVAYTPQWAARDAKDFWKQPPRDPKLYADFMNRIAARYRGRIASWEIWNEPDNKDYWTGTADEFAELVKAAAPSIRVADPQAVLVLGGVAYGPGEFFRRLLMDYHVDRYLDVVAMHAYPETWLNERVEAMFQQWVPDVQQMIAADCSGADLWINEMGYADYRFQPNAASVYGVDIFYKYEHTRSYQAAMLFKFHVMALASQQVSLTGWYRIDDFPATETRLGPDLVNFHLGVLDARGHQKPAFYAMRLFNRLFRTPSVLVNRSLVRPTESQSVVNVFRTKDARIVVVAWLRSSTAAEVRNNTGALTDTRSELVTAGLPCGRARLLRYYDLQGRRPQRREARLHDRSLNDIRLRGDEMFIAELACGSPN